VTLQSNGQMTFTDIQTEFGGSNPISLDEYYGAASGIPSSGAISMNQFYGKSNAHTITVGAYGTGSGCNKSYGYTSSNSTSPPWAIFSQMTPGQGASSQTLAPGGQEIRGITFSGHVGFKVDFARFIFTVAGNYEYSPTSVFNSITISSNSGVWAGPFKADMSTGGGIWYDAGQTSWAYQFSGACNVPNASGLGWVSGSTQTIVIT